MAMRRGDEFEGHGGGALNGVECTAGRAESAVAAKGNEFGMSAFGTAIKSSAEGRIAAVDHLLDVLQFDIARMASIFNFFVMITENLL